MAPVSRAWRDRCRELFRACGGDQSRVECLKTLHGDGLTQPYDARELHGVPSSKLVALQQCARQRSIVSPRRQAALTDEAKANGTSTSDKGVTATKLAAKRRRGFTLWRSRT
jgi:hypothetical protein